MKKQSTFKEWCDDQRDRENNEKIKEERERNIDSLLEDKNEKENQN